MQTEGGGRSDGAGCDTHVYNSPLSQVVLRSRSVGRNSSNWCLKIDVKAYVVPGLKYDLLLAKGLNKCCYAVYHHPDYEESGVYALINNKMDKAKSFPFMSEHSNFFDLKLEQMR